MKNVAIVSVVLMLFAATASAADLAVSNSTLGNMGLGSMQVMSDTDGLAVRGKGVSTAVWGGSQADWFGGQAQAHSDNNYQAASSWLGPVGSHSDGSSLSFAAEIQVLFMADPTGFALQVAVGAAIAGGSATANAF